MTLQAGLPSSGSRRLHISAFGIHTGGGLVLLRALLAASAGIGGIVLLDERLRGDTTLALQGADVRYIARSFASRISAAARLASEARPGDVLLCFNSLPPPLASAAHVITFVQAPHFVGLHLGIRYARLTEVRLFIETSWFRLAARHSDEIWVQTRSMAAGVKARFPQARVQTAPLVDNDLYGLLHRIQNPTPHETTSKEGCSFFYPADGVGHKNHTTLLQAWRLLAEAGQRPRLALTLQPHEWQALGSGAGLPQVVNLGRLPRERVLDALRLSSALIFPSRAETFGLPLLEASALGVPVLAGERDFVRDVCVPAQTFDPTSARSIADAVLRFIDGEPPGANACSAASFVQRLLA